MTDRRKKAPKIAWRDLMKDGDASAPPAAPVPPASAPEISVVADTPAAPAATAPTAPTGPAATDATRAPDASSPSALAARLDEAYTAMMAETAREQGVEAARASAAGASVTRAVASAAAVSTSPVPAPTTAPRPAGGAPPDINIALPHPVTSTITAHAQSRPPAATPEAEVQRILARLATYAPVARAATAAAPAAVGDAPALAARRGPVMLDEDEAPLVAPAGLRDAARARRGRAELLLFRAGGELFALPLAAVEEAIEAPAIHTLPEMPTAMLGVFNLRERLVPTYSPGPSLGVGLAEPAGAALLVRSGERRVALAADDIEDVMELDLSTLRDPPVVEDTDGILLGVARFGRDLVGILDADALISACLGGRNVENS